MTRMESDEKGGRPVPVTIFGQPYTLRTEEKSSYVESLAEYVDRKMHEVADLTRTADTAKIAILAALNIADDLHKQRRDSADVARDVSQRAKRIESLFDEVLAG